MENLLIRLNKIIAIPIFILLFGCVQDKAKIYLDTEAQKTYTAQIQAMVNLSEKFYSSNKDTMLFLNYYNKETTPFTAIDTAADFDLANKIGGVVAYQIKNNKALGAGLKIEHTAIYHYPIFNTYPIRPISFLYNTKYNTYHAWLPQDWAVYALSFDTTALKKYERTSTPRPTKYAKAYYNDFPTLKCDVFCMDYRDRKSVV